MIKSLAWSFFEQGGSKFIMLVVQIILARLLAPDAFGLLAIMLVVVDIANVLSQSGLGMALIQDNDTDDLACTTAFWLSLALSLGLYVIIFVMAPIIASFYGIPDLDACLRVISIAIPLNAAASIQRSILQRNMDFKSIFKSNISAVIVSGAAGIAAALLGWGVWALVLQTVLQAGIAMLVMSFQVPWHPSFAFSFQRMRSLFSYGWKICVTGVLNVVYTGVSELIIGKACDASQLGFYSQGRKWPNAGIHVASNALQNVLFPAFSMLKDDKEKLRSAIRKALDAGNAAIVPLSLLATVTAEPIVALLLGEKWLPCVPIFQLTCAANCVLMLQLVNLRAYMALGDSGLYLKLQIIKVVISCIAIWTVAISTRDIYFTALTTAICSVLCTLLVDLWPAEKMHGIGGAEQVRYFMPVLFSGLLAAVAAWLPVLLRLPYAGQLIIQLVVYILVYVFLVKLLRIRGGLEIAKTTSSLIKRKADVMDEMKKR